MESNKFTRFFNSKLKTNRESIHLGNLTRIQNNSLIICQVIFPLFHLFLFCFVEIAYEKLKL